MSQHPIITTTAGKYTLEWFPVELQVLREEIQYHPALLKILHNQDDKDIYVAISEISAYCGVVLDGNYSRDDIINLCALLIRKLQAMRTPLILPN